jgi:hypothetical protein
MVLLVQQQEQAMVAVAVVEAMYWKQDKMVVAAAGSTLTRESIEGEVVDL